MNTTVNIYNSVKEYTFWKTAIEGSHPKFMTFAVTVLGNWLRLHTVPGWNVQLLNELSV